MERAQINRVSVADQAAGILRHRILNGELRPGTPLQEIPLAAALGVSRNTMREAVRILCLEGLLVRSAHRGVAVERLSLTDVREIYQLRRLLEMTAILAARSPDAAVLGELRAALEQYENSVRRRDWLTAVGHDLQFHSLLIRFMKNRRLEVFYRKVIGELRMGMVLVDRSHNDPITLVPIHRKLYQLLVAGKRKQCAELLSRHLEDSEARLARILAQPSPTKPANLPV
jgi:DNA-binding GntR family transcriptional regulator